MATSLKSKAAVPIVTNTKIPLPRTYISVHRLAATGALKQLQHLLQPELIEESKAAVSAFGSRRDGDGSSDAGSAASQEELKNAGDTSPRPADSLLDSFLPDELLAASMAQHEDEDDAGPAPSMGPGGFDATMGHDEEHDDMPAPESIDVNAPDVTGFTPLMHAVRGGHTAVTQYLLDFNSGEVELDRQSVPGGMSALMLAAARGHEKVVAMLLGAGADVTLLDASDNSALHHAAQFGSLSLIKLLRGAACSASEQNKAGLTALMTTAIMGHTTAARDSLLVKVPLSEGVVRPAQGDAGGPSGGEGASELELTSPVDVNAQDDRGFTALHYAVEGGHVGFVEMLLAHGADMGVQGAPTPGHPQGIMPQALAASAEMKKLLASLAPGPEPVAAEADESSATAAHK